MLVLFNLPDDGTPNDHSIGNSRHLRSFIRGRNPKAYSNRSVRDPSYLLDIDTDIFQVGQFCAGNARQ